VVLRTGSEEINGATLHYELRGEGPTVTLVHAGIADCGMWDDQVDELAGRFQVLRYDARGYGRSTLPGGPYSHYGDLRALLEVLRIERTALVGCSMGGRIVLELAADAPELATALVPVAPGLPEHEWSDEIKRFGEEEDDLLERGELEEATELNLRIWVDGPRRSPEAVDPRVRRKVAAMQLQAFRVQVPAYERDPEPGPGQTLEPSLESRLGQISAPTLLVVGDEDVSDIQAICERLEREIPGARRVVIQNAAHVPNMERPAEFNRLVLDFLSAELKEE